MGLSNLQPVAYAVAYVSFFFGTASIFLRFHCRLFILRTWGWDDWVAVIVLMLSVGQQVILHLFLHFGCGLHVTLLSLSQQLQILKMLFIEEIFYYTMHWVIKSALLLFYLRLSPEMNFRILVYFGMALNGMIFLTSIFLACFQCIPFDEIFHPGTHPDATCINKLVLLIVPSILNILADLYILILPIRTVWNLQMSVRRKIAVLSVIGFGACAVLIACFRLIPLVQLNDSPDFSYIIGKIVIIAALEIQFAIIAISLPSLKALWLRIVSGSSSGSHPGSSNKKGYRLSSMKRAGNSGGAVFGDKPGRHRSDGTQSITRLKPSNSSTGSEEELFRPCGTGLQVPIQEVKMMDNDIEVKTDIRVVIMDKEDESVLPKPFLTDY